MGRGTRRGSDAYPGQDWSHQSRSDGSARDRRQVRWCHTARRRRPLRRGAAALRARPCRAAGRDGCASGCLLQVEGGPHMTLKQVEAVADAFTTGLAEDAQVIIGARVTPELGERMRVVAVVSGLPRGTVDGLL
ncbi:MAG TPA: hypothetical protein EYQ80_00130 [Candidatus Poseidoniales archaeon]|nr:hypothetical protein [Candidatus Poseidoniales archaeon]